MGIRKIVSIVCLVLILFNFLVSPGCIGPTEPEKEEKDEWWDQFGTGANDYAYGVSTDDKYVYVVGSTGGNLTDEESPGGVDAFIRKYDPKCGNVKWTIQFGSAKNDIAYDISIDVSGIYVVGETSGSLPGQTNSGNVDAFVQKFDFDGDTEWICQFGTPGDDCARGVSVDGKGLYITGYTDGAFSGQTQNGGFDGFVCRYNLSRNTPCAVDWLYQFGSSDDDYAMAIDTSTQSQFSGYWYSVGVYVTGYVEYLSPEEENYSDSIIYKFNLNGVEKWHRTFGSNKRDSAWDVALDSLGVYIVGETDGGFSFIQPNIGYTDAFVTMYDFNGDMNSTRSVQIGTSSLDWGRGITAECAGIFAVGSTAGTFPNELSAGAIDGLLYNDPSPSMTPVTSQFGKGTSDMVMDIIVNNLGILVCGWVNGTSADGIDAFAAKIKV